MAETNPRSSNWLSTEECEQRRKGGKSSYTSSSSNYQKTSRGGLHSSSKSHGGSSTQKSHRRPRTSRRKEENAKVHRKVQEAMESSPPADPGKPTITSGTTRTSNNSRGAEEEREAKRRAIDSSSSSATSHRTTHREDLVAKERAHRPTNSHSLGAGVPPGAYAASIDMDGRKTSPRLQIGHPFAFQGERNSESLDSIDSDDDSNFLSPREIYDQRQKLALRGTRSGASVPGAVSGKGIGRPNSKVFGSVSLEVIAGNTAPSSHSSSRQSLHQVDDNATVDPERQRDSSAPVLQAMAVEDMEDERVMRLEEQNLQLQRQMEDIRRARAAEVVQAKGAEPDTSKRTCMIIALFVFLALAAGGGVAGALLAGGSDDSNTQGSSIGENPSGHMDPSSGTSEPSVTPTTQPTLRQTSPPTPASAPVKCYELSEYFEGPFETSTLAQGTDYSIGCDGRPTTLIAISPNEKCIKCVGILLDSEYGTQCDETGSIVFQVPGAKSKGDTLHYGYSSTLSVNHVLPKNCPDGALQAV